MERLCVAIFGALFLCYSLGFAHSSKATISCDQTPHPKVCKHYINSSLIASKNLTLASFRLLSIRATLNLTIETREKISLVTKKWHDKNSKLALVDCLELYEDTIDILNRSVNFRDPTKSQTWLSTAIAYETTCENGFTNFKLGHRLKSDAFSNSIDYRKMISSSLAINNASLELNVAKNHRGIRFLRVLDGFPWWVSRVDQKLLAGVAVKPNITVAQDGSGDYEKILDAVEAMEGKKWSGRFVVYVKKGVYKENVEINSSMKNVMFIGDGIDATIVTGSRSNVSFPTYRTATFGISGEGFIAKGMTFENTAGPEKHQAVAMRSNSDSSVFYRCSFKGYQDTLYVHSKNQFYRECDIYGTIDFICGDATAVLQNCSIYVRKPLPHQENVIIAQSKQDLRENTGIVIHNSVVMAAPDLKPVQGSFKTYLGRPWKEYATTVVMKCRLDELIDPAGWMSTGNDSWLKTLYYGEYMNTGSGVDTGKRVKWPGYHVLTNQDAERFTVAKIYNGYSWISDAGVPFDAGL